MISKLASLLVHDLSMLWKDWGHSLSAHIFSVGFFIRCTMLSIRFIDHDDYSYSAFLIKEAINSILLGIFHHNDLMRLTLEKKWEFFKLTFVLVQVVSSSPNFTHIILFHSYFLLDL